jgi:GntR family transcriptional regulator
VALNKTSPIPIYYQLAEFIREQIRLGELRPGDQVPSERILAEQYAISRMTVRQAMTFLVRDGTLVTHHGLGTFVAEPKLTHEVSHLLGFSQEMMQQGGVAVSRVLEQQQVVPTARIVAALQLPAGAGVTKIMRLRFVDQQPLLLETSYLPTALCPGLEHEDLAMQSLYTVLHQRYGVSLHAAHQSLEATIANDYEAELFGIAPGMAMLLLEGLAFDEQKRPVEYFKAIYRGDRFKFTFTSEHAMQVADSEATQIRVVLT